MKANAVKASGPQAKPYAKTAGQTASVGEALALAQSHAAPAILTARFAAFVSFIALIVAGIALTLAMGARR